MTAAGNGSGLEFNRVPDYLCSLMVMKNTLQVGGLIYHAGDDCWKVSLTSCRRPTLQLKSTKQAGRDKTTTLLNDVNETSTKILGNPGRGAIL